MWFFALAGSAVVPSLLLFWYIHSRDEHPEPRGMLMATFALGAATAIPVLAVVVPFSAVIPPPEGVWPGAGWKAFLHAAVPEETFKFLVLMTFCYRSPHFDEPFDGVVYGATASLGFATLENILYVAQGGLGVAIMRALTAVPGHAFTGVVMGYFVGRAKFASHGRGWMAFQGLLYATLLHGLYDMFLLSQTIWFLVSAPVLLVEVIWGVVLIRKMRVDGFIPPLPQGVAHVAGPGMAAATPFAGPGYGPFAGPSAPGYGPPAGPSAPSYAAAGAPAPVGQARPPATDQALWPRRRRVRVGRVVSGALLASVCGLLALAGMGGLLVEGGEEAAVAGGLLVVGLGGLVGGVLLFASGLGPLRSAAASREA